MDLSDKIFFDKDISIEPILGKKVGIIGYGSQGKAQALNLKDSGACVVAGLREDSQSILSVREDGLECVSIDSLIDDCDIVSLLIPDNQIDSFLLSKISRFKKHQTILVSHGYAIVYGKTQIPDNINIVMVAPSGGGAVVRSEYEKGFGVPALIAIQNSYSEGILNLTFAYAKAIGSSRAAVFLSTFKEETETDLFGEQAILTGSIPLIIIESYKVLLEGGYDPLVSWFVCFYELKTIVNLMFEKGLSQFYDMVSDTARYGGISRGQKLIDGDFKEKLKLILQDIKRGSFKNELESELSRGNDGREKFESIFSSEEFKEIENKILEKIKNKVN